MVFYSVPEFTCHLKEFLVCNLIWITFVMTVANCQIAGSLLSFLPYSAIVLQILIIWQLGGRCFPSPDIKTQMPSTTANDFDLTDLG